MNKSVFFFFCGFLNCEPVAFSGARALYKGLGPTLLRTAPATAALFLAYETTKKTLKSLLASNSEIAS